MDKQTLTSAFQLMLKNTIKGQLSKISLLFSFTCLFPLLEVAVFRCDLSQCMLEIQLPRQRFSWKVLVNFSVAAPHLWNSLPKDAHLVPSLTCLRCHMKMELCGWAFHWTIFGPTCILFGLSFPFLNQTFKNHFNCFIGFYCDVL